MHVGQVREAVGAAYEALRGAEGFAAEAGVASALQALGSAAQYDADLQPWLELLQETQTLLAEAAGTIHSDFQRGFICAEVASYNAFVECGGEAGARDAGQLRQEGRDYIVQDGDVIHFRFNV